MLEDIEENLILSHTEQKLMDLLIEAGALHHPGYTKIQLIQLAGCSMSAATKFFWDAGRLPKKHDIKICSKRLQENKLKKIYWID